MGSYTLFYQYICGQLVNEQFEDFNVEDLASLEKIIAEITQGETLDYHSLLGRNKIKNQTLLNHNMEDAAIKKYVNDATNQVATLLVKKANPLISRKIREFKAKEIVLDKDELQNNLMSTMVFAYQSYQDLIEHSLIEQFDSIHKKISKNIAENFRKFRLTA